MPSGDGTKAGHFLVVGPDPGLMAEVDDRQVLVEDGFGRIVFLLAHGIVLRLACLEQQLVDVRVAVFGVVEAGAGRHELVDVAVGIDAAGPIRAAELVVAGGLARRAA